MAKSLSASKTNFHINMPLLTLVLIPYVPIENVHVFLLLSSLLPFVLTACCALRCSEGSLLGLPANEHTWECWLGSGCQDNTHTSNP